MSGGPSGASEQVMARNDAKIPASWMFGALSATLASGYGVLFTVVADYRDEYGISETAIGWLIGIGFIVGFVAQALIAPIGDRGHARTLIRAGVLLNVVGLLMLGFGESLEVLLVGLSVEVVGGEQFHVHQVPDSPEFPVLIRLANPGLPFVP